MLQRKILSHLENFFVDWVKTRLYKIYIAITVTRCVVVVVVRKAV